MKTPYLAIIVALGTVAFGMMLLPHANAMVPLVMITIQGGANSPSCGNSCITPQNVIVDRGTAVEWINKDLVPHTIVSGNSGDNDNGSLFNSGPIWVGNNFIHDFNDVGMFHYFDPTHTWDAGTIQVTNDTLLASSSQSTSVNFQSNEELVKKLASARDTIASLMINGTGDIPFNEVGVIEKNMTLGVGIDSAKATLSEEQYLEKIKAIVGDIPIKITFGVINPTANMTRSSEGNSFSKLILSPLKQLQSGIKAKDVTCGQGSWLIFKTSDGSPACVKPDTAYVLIEHGWTKKISQTSLNITSSYSSSPCEIPYPQSNAGVAILYMSPNSTGKICAMYHNPDSPVQSSIRVFTAKDVQQQAGEITASAYPDMVPNGNSTIVYTIKTGNQAGLYGISFFCNSTPFAVGYDNQSRIILDDFPWLYKSDICLSQTNVFQITGLSGIHVKYVTTVHREVN